MTNVCIMKIEINRLQLANTKQALQSNKRMLALKSIRFIFSGILLMHYTFMKTFAIGCNVWVVFNVFYHFICVCATHKNCTLELLLAFSQQYLIGLNNLNYYDFFFFFT